MRESLTHLNIGSMTALHLINAIVQHLKDLQSSAQGLKYLRRLPEMQSLSRKVDRQVISGQVTCLYVSQ